MGLCIPVVCLSVLSYCLISLLYIFLPLSFLLLLIHSLSACFSVFQLAALNLSFSQARSLLMCFVYSLLHLPPCVCLCPCLSVSLSLHLCFSCLRFPPGVFLWKCEIIFQDGALHWYSLTWMSSLISWKKVLFLQQHGPHCVMVLRANIRKKKKN